MEKEPIVRIKQEYMKQIIQLMKTHKEINKPSDFVNDAVAVRLVNYKDV